ncbi:hypothetical protein SUGI_0548680 [Cryptomeria japonica]|nr:hypothetical protein SUGI_0548680 [Cryptomeria japonica]
MLIFRGQTTVSDEEDPHSIEVDQSMAEDVRLEQSAVASSSKAAIQVTVALVIVGGSFAAMYTMPGRVNESGKAVMGDTIAFIVFLVANTLAFHASLAVVMIVATVSHIIAKIDYLIHIVLWTVAVCLALTFHASAFVVVLPNQQWIVLCFRVVATIELALLLLYCFPTEFYSRISTTGNGGIAEGEKL